ncbi:MAG: hypothetical protein F4186_11225 [Boseongicola sp. SB0676_bin_33]|nr:hypothetical protein [Boseongicola sp. SB0676_bin_33]
MTTSLSTLLTAQSCFAARLVLSVALIALAPVAPTQAASPSKCEEWTKMNFWRDATAADVRDCLATGAKINARGGKWGWTPLHYAAFWGRTAATQALLDAGAEVNAKNEHGLTPLYYATGSGGVTSVEILDTLLDAGADPSGGGGLTVLHFDAIRGRTAALRTRISEGADINVAALTLMTPLHYAALWGHTAVVEALLDGDAKVDVRNKSNMTPLYYAAWKGHTAVLKALLDVGAEADVPDNRGWAPLHYAAVKGHLAAMKALLDGGAEVDVRNEEDETPLHAAVSTFHNVNVEVVNALLDGGADGAARNGNGETPFDIARKKSQLKGSALLRRLNEARLR